MTSAQDAGNHKSQISNPKLGKYFLYVGNAYPHKNLDKLIEVFSDFQKEIKDVKLILVGTDDFFYSRLKQKIKKINILKMLF